MNTAPFSSDPFSQSLPEWQHQAEFDAICAKFEPLARASAPVQCFLQIKGTTGDYYDAIAAALPEAENADLYRKFISGNSTLSPFHAVAHAIRDSQFKPSH